MSPNQILPHDGPVVEGLEHLEHQFGAGQKQYLPLRAICSRTPEGIVLTRWSPTPAQRIAIANGMDIFLTVMTFHQPLQPVGMVIGERVDPAEIVETYQLAP